MNRIRRKKITTTYSVERNMSCRRLTALFLRIFGLILNHRPQSKKFKQLRGIRKCTRICIEEIAKVIV